jgi:hypothetical protein
MQGEIRRYGFMRTKTAVTIFSGLLLLLIVALFIRDFTRGGICPDGWVYAPQSYAGCLPNKETAEMLNRIAK